jgi:prepilin-type processing-associated H-X9-DG protein
MQHPPRAFTLMELLVIIAMLVVVAALLLPAFTRAKHTSQSICCNCNLKQIGLGFKTWAIDYTNSFPMSIATNFGGTREYIATGETFRHFAAVSNEVSTPRVLVCPRDSRRSAADFGRSFGNSNLSYFVGIEAEDASPQMFLAGDRNITNGVMLPNRVLELTTNHLTGWTRDLHDGWGNVALADGSVQGFTTIRLREAIPHTGAATNRLAMP